MRGHDQLEYGGDLIWNSRFTVRDAPGFYGIPASRQEYRAIPRQLRSPQSEQPGRMGANEAGVPAPHRFYRIAPALRATGGRAGFGHRSQFLVCRRSTPTGAWSLQRLGRFPSSDGISMAQRICAALLRVDDPLGMAAPSGADIH